MIKNKVLKTKQNITLPFNIKVEKGQEFEIVMNVVYMNGYPLPNEMQLTILTWIESNITLFDEIITNW